MSTRKLYNVVGGERRDAAEGRTLELVDPSTGAGFAAAALSGQAEIGADNPSGNPAPGTGDGPRFGTFPPGQPAPLPAPALPTTRLRPRD